MSYTVPQATHSKQSIFLLAIRPKTLPASLSPVILGTATVAPEHLNWLLALCALGCALFLQITVNLANDYFDAKSGVDTQQRLGPVRVTQSGLAAPSTVAAGMALFVALSVICGLVLVAHSDPVLLAVGLLCLLAAFGYSGGPYPLASHGLGELAVLVFFGWVAVMGSAYVHTHTYDTRLFVLANGLGVILAAIMLVNNIRDIPTDRQAGKLTLAVKLGAVHSRRLYVLLLILTVACHIAVFQGDPKATVIPLLIFIPFAARACYHLYGYQGAEMNRLLAETSVLSLIYSIPTSVFLVLN